MSASTAVYTLRTEATEKGDSNSTHRVYRAVTWGYLVDNSGSETLTADKSEKELLRERLHRLHQAVVWAGQVWLASDPGSRFASENVAKYAEEAAGLMNDDKLSIWGNQSHHAETMDSLFARRPDEDPTQLGTPGRAQSPWTMIYATQSANCSSKLKIRKP